MGYKTGTLLLLLALTGCSRGRTRVVEFLPTSVPPQAQTVAGSCWTHSIAAPARPDAWRCAIGNRIEDPCFEIAGRARLLCSANPAAPAAAHPLLLELTLPLPHEPVPASTPRHPWLIELAGGALCRPFTGTRPIAANGMAGTYACTNGAILLGALSAHAGGVWTAEAGALQPSPSGLPHLRSRRTVAIQALWR